MGYYIRAFCTRPPVPELAAIQEWLRNLGSQAVLDEPDHAVDAARAAAPNSPVLRLDTSDWEQVAVTYKAGKLPILAECNRGDGTQESLVSQEVAEFIDLVEEAEAGAARDRVLRHLRETSFIIACQLPTSDIDDDGYDANGDFLNYFAERCGGMIQADGEGFYDHQNLLLAVK